MIYYSRCGTDSNTYLNALIDEFRVSKGITRWTANFTPPTTAYGQVTPTGSKRRFAQLYKYMEVNYGKIYRYNY